MLGGRRFRTRRARSGQPIPWYVMLRQGRYKYVRPLLADDLEELYDLSQDPDELDNLAQQPKYRSTVKELAAKAVAYNNLGQREAAGTQAQCLALYLQIRTGGRGRTRPGQAVRNRSGRSCRQRSAQVIPCHEPGALDGDLGKLLRKPAAAVEETDSGLAAEVVYRFRQGMQLAAGFKNR